MTNRSSTNLSWYDLCRAFLHAYLLDTERQNVFNRTQDGGIEAVMLHLEHVINKRFGQDTETEVRKIASRQTGSTLSGSSILRQAELGELVLAFHVTQTEASDLMELIEELSEACVVKGFPTIAHLLFCQLPDTHPALHTQ